MRRHQRQRGNLFRTFHDDLMKKMVGEEAFQKLQSFISEGMRPSSRSLNIALTSVGKGKEPYTQKKKMLFNILNMAEKHNITPTVFLYNPILQSMGSKEELSDFWDNMLMDGILPDKASYHIFIQKEVKFDNLPGALHKFKEAKMEGIVPHLYTYSSIISALLKKGNYEEIDNLLEEMKERYIKPDEITLLALVQESIGNIKPNEAWKYILYGFHQHNLLPPRRFTYQLIKLFCTKPKVKNPDIAIEIVEFMKSIGNNVPDDICEVILTHCGKRLHAEDRQMIEQEKASPPNYISFEDSNIMQSMVNGPNSSAAIMHYEKLLSQGKVGHLYTYPVLLQYYTGPKDTFRAFALLQEVCQKMKPTQIIFDIILRSFAMNKNKIAVESVLEKAKLHDIHFGSHSVNAMVFYFASRNTAASIFPFIEENNIQLTSENYSALLMHQGKAETKEGCLKIISMINENKYVPKPYTLYCDIIKYLCKYDQYEKIAATTTEMRENNVGIESNLYHKLLWYHCDRKIFEESIDYLIKSIREHPSFVTEKSIGQFIVRVLKENREVAHRLYDIIFAIHDSKKKISSYFIGEMINFSLAMKNADRALEIAMLYKGIFQLSLERWLIAIAQFYVKENNIDEAKNVLKQCAQLDIPCSQSIFMLQELEQDNSLRKE